MTTRVVGVMQRRLLALMIACYLVAAVFPGPGEIVRAVTLRSPAGGSFTVSMILLAVMLFTAGLGVRARDLAGVVRSPLRLALGVAVNALLPVVLLPVAAVFLRAWPDTGEAESLTVGLLLVLAMPIAGGAASWGRTREATFPW